MALTNLCWVENKYIGGSALKKLNLEKIQYF